MHRFVFFNRRTAKAETANISAVSSAALYGKGIFTTLAVYDSEIFLWEKHWRRLQKNAAHLSIDLSEFSEAETKESVSLLIIENRVKNGRIRLTFFDESTDKIWNSCARGKTNLLIMSADFRPVPSNFRLAVSPFSVNSASPLAGIKSCNYSENIFALREARNRNFDEAVRLNERGEIVSACAANIFWKKNGKIFTPALETGALAGTMREFFMEKNQVFEVREKIEVLSKADEIFLTSSGIAEVKISEFCA